MKFSVEYPLIDLTATGVNIKRIRKAKGFKVREVSEFMGFEQPQAVYKWEAGKCLPSLDNLLAISVLFGVKIDDILVRVGRDVILLWRKLAFCD